MIPHDAHARLWFRAYVGSRKLEYRSFMYGNGGGKFLSFCNRISKSESNSWRLHCQKSSVERSRYRFWADLCISVSAMIWRLFEGSGTLVGRISEERTMAGSREHLVMSARHLKNRGYTVRLAAKKPAFNSANLLRCCSFLLTRLCLTPELVSGDTGTSKMGAR